MVCVRMQALTHRPCGHAQEDQNVCFHQGAESDDSPCIFGMAAQIDTILADQETMAANITDVRDRLVTLFQTSLQGERTDTRCRRCWMHVHAGSASTREGGVGRPSGVCRRIAHASGSACQIRVAVLGVPMHAAGGAAIAQLRFDGRRGGL